MMDVTNYSFVLERHWQQTTSRLLVPFSLLAYYYILYLLLHSAVGLLEACAVEAYIKANSETIYS